MPKVYFKQKDFPKKSILSKTLAFNKETRFQGVPSTFHIEKQINCKKLYEKQTDFNLNVWDVAW